MTPGIDDDCGDGGNVDATVVVRIVVSTSLVPAARNYTSTIRINIYVLLTSLFNVIIHRCESNIIRFFHETDLGWLMGLTRNSDVSTLTFIKYISCAYYYFYYYYNF